MRSKKIFGALLSLYGSGQAFSGAYIGAGGDASGAVNTSNGTYDFYNADDDNYNNTSNLSVSRLVALRGGMGKVVLGIDRIVASGKGYLALEGSARLGSSKGSFNEKKTSLNAPDDEQAIVFSLDQEYKNTGFFDLMAKAGGSLGNAFPYLQMGPGYGRYEITLSANEVTDDNHSEPEKKSEKFDLAFLGVGAGITYSIAPSVQLDFSSKVFLSQTKAGFKGFLKDDDGTLNIEQDTYVKFTQWLSGFSLRYNGEENMCACPGAPAPQGVFGYGGLNLSPSLTSMDYNAAFDMESAVESGLVIGRMPKGKYGIFDVTHGLALGLEMKQGSLYSALEVNANYSPRKTDNIWKQDNNMLYSHIFNTTFSDQLNTDALIKLGYQVGNSAFYFQGGYGLSKVSVQYDGAYDNSVGFLPFNAPSLSQRDVWFNNGVVGAGINSQLHKNLSMDIGAKAYIGGKEEAFKNFLDDPDSEDETFRNTVSTFQPIELIGNCSLRYQFSLD